MYLIKELQIIKDDHLIFKPEYVSLGYVETEADALSYTKGCKIYTSKDHKHLPHGTAWPNFISVKIKLLKSNPLNISSDSVMDKIPDTKLKIEIIEVPIDMTEFTLHELAGMMHKNKGNVYNIPDTPQDVLRSIQWFNNTPIDLHVVINDKPKIGDWCIDKNFHIRKFDGLSVHNDDLKPILESTNKVINLPLSKEALNKILGKTNTNDLKKYFTESYCEETPETPELALHKTFDGQVLKYDELDHQHLSNIYWYNMICLNNKPLNIVNIINNRFYGEILPYKPMLKFKDEIAFLESRGYLVWTDKGDYLLGEIFLKNKGRIGTLYKLK
jgi:hypothetical protein